MFVCDRQAEEVIHEATEEAIVEEEYVGQEVDEVAAQVAAEVLRYYTDKRRVQETKKVRWHSYFILCDWYLHTCVLFFRTFQKMFSQHVCIHFEQYQLYYFILAHKTNREFGFLLFQYTINMHNIPIGVKYITYWK